MASYSFISVFLLSLTHAAAGLQSSDDLMMFATLGDSVTLPCGIRPIESCSRVNWSKKLTGKFEEVVKAGRLTDPNVHRHSLLKDCSLRINHLELNDARHYSCVSGSLSSNVSLYILNISENQAPENKIELHCFLSTHTGYIRQHCDNRGIHIKWSTEDNTPINGSRFDIKNPSDCFSKLLITKKKTDHHRKWKCQLFQNDMAKAAFSYTTTVKDGIEEVFVAVGESVSLSCSNTSSLGVGMVSERKLANNNSHHKGQTEAYYVIQESSLVISKVSALHAKDYKCSESTGQQNVFRLHTLDVSAEYGPGGDNLTLSCVLTCSKECEKVFSLTWSEHSQNSLQSRLIYHDNTLINRLFFPVSMTDELTCFVHREGELMASKLHTGNSPVTPLYLALTLGLLICIAAGGLYMYMKRKHNKDTGNEESDIEMNHVYEDVQDANEELKQQRQNKQEASDTNSFYDLLQAVN